MTTVSASVWDQLPGVVVRYVWGRRVGDFAVLAAIPLAGFLYGVQEFDAHAVWLAAGLSMVSVLLMIHIFSLNDWADYFDDRLGRAEKPSNDGGRDDRTSLLIVAASSAALVFLGLWLMRPAATIPAAATVVCSALYSCRWPTHGKGTLLLSSLLHFACGASCFILGLTTASGSGSGQGNIAIFLGLSMIAGHINQEISDHREDQASRTRTYSTVLGPARSFVIGQIVFTIAFAFLLAGMHDGWASLFGPLVISMWSANVALAIGCCGRGVGPESVERYRLGYRLLYVLIGLSMVAHALLQQR